MAMEKGYESYLLALHSIYDLLNLLDLSPQKEPIFMLPTLTTTIITIIIKKWIRTFFKK